MQAKKRVGDAAAQLQHTHLLSVVVLESFQCKVNSLLCHVHWHAIELHNGSIQLETLLLTHLVQSKQYYCSKQTCMHTVGCRGVNVSPNKQKIPTMQHQQRNTTTNTHATVQSIINAPKQSHVHAGTSQQSTADARLSLCVYSFWQQTHKLFKHSRNIENQNMQKWVQIDKTSKHPQLSKHIAFAIVVVTAQTVAAPSSAAFPSAFLCHLEAPLRVYPTLVARKCHRIAWGKAP